MTQENDKHLTTMMSAMAWPTPRMDLKSRILAAVDDRQAQTPFAAERGTMPSGSAIVATVRMRIAAMAIALILGLSLGAASSGSASASDTTAHTPPHAYYAGSGVMMSNYIGKEE